MQIQVTQKRIGFFSTVTPRRTTILLLITMIAATALISGLTYQLGRAQTSSTTALTIASGVYPQATYTVWTESGFCYAKDAYGDLTTWGIGSTNASYVLQNTLNAMVTNGGRLHINVGNYSCHNVTIPSTSKQIIVEGDGMRSTLLVSNAACDYVLGRQSSGAYAHYVTVQDLGINGNGTAQQGVDMSEPLFADECPKSILLQRVRVNNHVVVGFNMSHCDNSELIDCECDDLGTSKIPIQWHCITGVVKIVRGYYHPGNIQVAGQGITLDKVQLSGVEIVDNSHALHLIDCEMPAAPVLSSGAFIEVDSGKWLGSCELDNTVLSMSDGDVVFAGEYAQDITVTNLKIYISSGDTCTIFPSSPTLTSKDIAGGYPCVCRLSGLIFSSPAGTVNVVEPGFVAGVDIAEIDFSGNTHTYGNHGWAVTPTNNSGSYSYKNVTLPISLASGSYVVLVHSASVEGNSCWVESRTNTGFTLWWSCNTTIAWAVDWKLIYTGL